MTKQGLLLLMRGGVAIAAIVVANATTATDISTDPLNTYSAPSSTDVKPNVLFILDDSGSMDSADMPDEVGSYSGTAHYYKNNALNGVAYNPAVTYRKPAHYNSDGTANTTTYPSMTGASAATGADMSFATPNWRSVPRDGYGIQSTSTSNLVGSAYAYVSIAGEYCDSPALRTCVSASAPTGSYIYSAPVRWCSTSDLTTCRATYDATTYSNLRMASPRTATITVSGSSNTSVSHITVNGEEILSGTTSASSTAGTLATYIRDAINNCTNTITGQCTIAGYSASVSVSGGSEVTIKAPVAVSVAPIVTRGNLGTMAFTTTNFVVGTVPGENLRVTITSGINSYPYPGSATKAATRTDCASTTCTYVEEMTNYANWHAYYRTRMQMMKTGASLAFSVIDSAADVTANVSRFRVGFLSIDNTTGSDFLNLDEFKTSQKATWYAKLFAADPGAGTPLREALSTAGRLFGGKLNGATLNGGTVTDPLQYSCQQNYAILSTDGYWNGNGGKKLNGTTDMDNQDSALAAPYNDGGVANTQERTSSLQSRTSTLQGETATLQVETAILQSETGTLRGRVSQVLMKCNNTTAACGSAPANGISNANWSVVTSCTNGSGTNAPRCSRIAPSPTLYRDVTSSCNTGASIDTTSPYNWSGSDGGYYYTSCSYTWSAATPAGSCTYNVDSTPNSSTTLTATRCSYSAWGAAAPAASCTYTNKTTSTTNGTVYQAAPAKCSYSAATLGPVGSCTSSPTTTSTSNGTVYNASPVTCSYTTFTPWTYTSSCTALARSSSSPYTVGTATECQYTAWTGWSTTVGSCTAQARSTAPNYTVETARECQTLSSGGTSNTLADVAAYYYGKDLRSSSATGNDETGTCTGPIIAPATTPNDLCADNVPPNGVDVAQTQHMTTFTLGLGAQGKMVYSPTYPSDQSGDYYDVRVRTTAAPASGVCSWMSSGETCTWPVPGSNSTANIDDLWHAAVNGRGTYYSAKDPDSLATGLSSTLATIINTPRPGTAAAAASSNPNISTSDNYVFSSSYKSVDWYGELIRQQIDHSGNLTPQQWSAMILLDCGASPWKASTSYTAGAVYRNGTTCYMVTADYVSGTTFDTADTDNATIVYGAPNWAATANYATGSVYRYGGSCYLVTNDYASGASFGSIDLGNASVTPTDTRCNAITPQTSRSLYTKGPSGLMAFDWDHILSESLSAYFTAPAITYVSANVGLSQFCSAGATCLSAAQQSNTTIADGGAAGEALVKYLAGDRSYEGTYFRERVHVLGDIVSSEGRYVKVPMFSYADANYGAFKTAQASRAGTVYVSANDGMLHAFNAETGQERWAYVPAAVLPNLYKLADKNYKTKHQYYVDNSPETGDICPNAPASTCSSSQWKTILVGGLNRGGKGYFALDITNPSSPSLLWEISDATAGFTNLGYTYGNPRITKLKDGTWVVLFASGYNNADGVGRLYVVNADTGGLIRTISTGTGSADTPSGLARIAAHSTTATTDNTVRAVYGGDLLGNLWRFDVNGDIAPSGYEAHRLTSFAGADSNAQPISSKPLVATISGKPVVFVGTGRYLGVTDVSNTNVQGFYAVKDNSDATTFSNPRAAGSGFVQQVLSSGTCPEGAPTTVCEPGQAVRTTTSYSVEWTTSNGWFFDFVTGGERSTTDSSLALGTLIFTTIYPNNSSASACGTEAADVSASYVYAVDYKTGGALSGTAGVAAVSLGNVSATRPVIVRLADGSLRGVVRTSGGGGSGGTDMGGTEVVKPAFSSSSGSTRRVSWRELVNEQ